MRTLLRAMEPARSTCEVLLDIERPSSDTIRHINPDSRPIPLIIPNNG